MSQEGEEWADAHPADTPPWLHRVVTVEPCGRVPIGDRPAVFRASLEHDRWALRPGPGGVQLDARGRVAVPLGVLAVLGVEHRKQAVVNRSADGIVFVCAACHTSRLLEVVKSA